MEFQVLGSTPRGSEFQAGVKKIPSSVLRQSTGLRNRPVLTGLRCRCVWVGQGFGGFLDLREKVLLLNAMPGVAFPPQVQFFFYDESSKIFFYDECVYKHIHIKVKKEKGVI